MRAGFPDIEVIWVDLARAGTRLGGTSELETRVHCNALAGPVALTDPRMNRAHARLAGSPCGAKPGGVAGEPHTAPSWCDAVCHINDAVVTLIQANDSNE